MTKLRILIILTAILSVFILVTPVLAYDNPDAIDLNSVRVYQNVYESGDWLILCDYDITYNVTPPDPATDTFCLVLRDGSNITAVGETISYNHSIGMIYLGSSDVADRGLTWGNVTYNVSVMGHPDYFDNWEEGVNMTTTVLTSGYWITGTTEESRDYLASRIILLMKFIEIDWGEDYVTVNNKLSEEGADIVLAVIPYLNIICPNIFENPSQIPGYIPPDYNPEYEERLLTRAGARLSAVLANASQWLLGRNDMGILIGGLGVAILYFILAGRIFVATGSVPGAIAISIPFLVGGNLIRLIPLSITFIAAFFAALAFGVTYMLGRF